MQIILEWCFYESSSDSETFVCLQRKCCNIWKTMSVLQKETHLDTIPIKATALQHAWFVLQFSLNEKMLKRSDSGFASKAAKQYMYVVVYNVTVLHGNLQTKFMLLLSLAFFSFLKTCINVFTTVIICADFEEKECWKYGRWWQWQHPKTRRWYCGRYSHFRNSLNFKLI